MAIQATGFVDVTNAGIINATGNTAIVSLGDNIVLRNAGAVSAASSAVLSPNAIMVTNSGSIQTTATNGETISAFGNVDLKNSGTISATGTDLVAVAAGFANNAALLLPILRQELIRRQQIRAWRFRSDQHCQHRHDTRDG